MSDHFQSLDMQLATAIDRVQSVISVLQHKRTEEAWEDIWSSANDLCGWAGIDIVQNQQVRRRAQPRHLQDFIVNSQTVEGQPLAMSDDYRNHCFYPVIDNLVNEMNQRFSRDSCNILKGVSAWPSTMGFAKKNWLPNFLKWS
ncbi:hypothetical protein EOD39_12966 [Acipenser ruthenus]|uniref:Uncharacterized protein n=1 Tax=Acipenser ruthenus TaxID=7906 RepID=A0A662YPA5_ACIRT|nr:hypothetical protein EOD39_12966 [Acipenser ruthenus]